MSFSKKTFIDNQTVIDAATLNAIQDELIRVAGLLGKDIQSAVINDSGHLILTLTDGTTLDAGVAKGAKGDTGPAGLPGLVIGSTRPAAGNHPVWLDISGDEVDAEGLGISSATVGQIAKISAVDDNGVPTAWEPVDMPSGGGLQWIEVVDITTEEQTQKLTISVDKDGRPISQYNALWMVFSILFPADASQTSTNGTAWIYPFPKIGENAYRYIASVSGWKTVTRTLTYAWAGLPRLAWSSAMAGQMIFGTDGDPDFLSGLCMYLSSSGDHIPVGTRVRIAVLSKGVTA